MAMGAATIPNSSHPPWWARITAFSTPPASQIGVAPAKTAGNSAEPAGVAELGLTLALGAGVARLR